jgi:transposase
MGFEEIEKKKFPGRAAEKGKVEGVRASMMAIDRAMGMSIKEIAEDFKVSPATVKSYLSTAEEEGFIDHYRRAMYDRLAPKVLAVYEAHLEQGSLQAARDLAQGLGILQNSPPKAKEKAITTLAEWRAEKDEEKDAQVQ